MKRILILSFIVSFLMGNSVYASNHKMTVFEEIISTPTDINHKNIVKNEKNIAHDVDLKLDTLNNTIDRNINSLFNSIEANVDTYLDFHYSVAGEYVELATAMTGDLEKEIQDRLLGKNFDNTYENISKSIENQYTNTLEQHFINIDRYASEGIDMELNPNIFSPVIVSIKENEAIQKMKISSVAGVAIGAKIATVIAAKASLKMAGKAALKTGTKAAAAGTGATLGLACGPAAPLCSVGLALGAWFGTDAIIVTGDEMINRDEFKNKIISSLSKMKNDLKENFKIHYKENFIKTSEEIVNTYKNTPLTIKKRKEEEARAQRIKGIF